MSFATSPKFACVCVGKNTYGHPSSEVMERILQYDKINSSNLYDNLYSTKVNGNVIFTLQNQIAVNTIKNINDYSFGSYYVYSTLVVIILVGIILAPYIKLYIKKRRLLVQNKKFEESGHKSINVKDN